MQKYNVNNFCILNKYCLKYPPFTQYNIVRMLVGFRLHFCGNVEP